MLAYSQRTAEAESETISTTKHSNQTNPHLQWSRHRVNGSGHCHHGRINMSQSQRHSYQHACQPPRRVTFEVLTFHETLVLVCEVKHVVSSRICTCIALANAIIIILGPVQWSKGQTHVSYPATHEVCEVLPRNHPGGVIVVGILWWQSVGILDAHRQDHHQQEPSLENAGQ